MSYDLAVWAEHPADNDNEATEHYVELLTAREDGPQTPSERIRAYVTALTERYPEITAEALEDASGPFLRLFISYSQLPEVGQFVLEEAVRHDLTCFDPQVEKLLVSEGQGWVEE